MKLMKLKQRLFSVLTVAAMLVSLMPTTLAADVSDETISENDELLGISEVAQITKGSGTSTGVQGGTVYENYFVNGYNYGMINIYDLESSNPTTPIAEFKLASYAGSDVASGYRNHTNQIMFGAEKWDVDDPFPLLYVTTGNTGDQQSDGSYISKCAVERIVYDGTTGEWSSQLVQTIQFADGGGVGYTYADYVRGEGFIYESTPTWTNSKGYQKVCWGWPASFVDSDPTETTNGKFYIFSARFRTTVAYENTWTNHYAGQYDDFCYFTDNAYIITEFDLPELPKSEAEFAQTVTLNPSDIMDQFATEFDVYYTQGGTMYQGKLYYSFGNEVNSNEDEYQRNQIRVWDIKEQEIVGRINLKATSFNLDEPECCMFYKSKLCVNTQKLHLYSFDFVASNDSEVTSEATCVSPGEWLVKDVVSGEERTKIIPVDSDNHADVVVDAAVEATTTTTGLTEGRHCAACNAVIVAQEVIPLVKTVVYVKDAGSNANDGATEDTAVATLTRAYALLDPNAGGTIVVCGNLSITAAPSVENSGAVTITGSYGGTDYNPTITVTNSSPITLVFGEKTVIDDVNFVGTSTGSITFYTKASLTLGSGITTDETTSTTKKYQVFGGHSDKDYDETEIKIYGGNYAQVFLGSNAGGAVGAATCTIGGTAQVLSNVRTGAYNANVGALTLNIDGEDCWINAIYIAPYSTSGTAIAADSVAVNLIAGGIGVKGFHDFTSTNSLGAVSGDVTVTIYPEFDLSKTTVYAPSGGTYVTLEGDVILNLPGWSGTVPSGMFTNYCVVNITDSSDVTYAGAMENKTLTVETGSTICLPYYADETEVTAAGMTLNANTEGFGTVTFVSAEDPYLEVVYLNGETASSGNGKTAATAVKTLPEAYALLEKTEGGTIVLCGDITVSSTPSTSHEGLITFTSRDPSTGETYDAAMTIGNSGAAFYLFFGYRTAFEDFTFAETGTYDINIYTGISFMFGENVTTGSVYPGAQYKVYCGSRAENLSDKDLYIKLMSGNFQQILLGNTTNDVGDVTFIFGGTAYVVSNVSLGGQSHSSGNIDFTMTGGYIKVIYDTPRYGGTVGDVALKLLGGSITDIRDYNKLSTAPAVMGNITVYLGPNFSSAGTLGVWTDGNLTTGEVVLVVTDYAGVNLSGLGIYDVVTLLGGSTVPDGIDISPDFEEGDCRLQICGYQGEMSMDLSGFTDLSVTNNSDLWYLGAYPDGLPLYVEEGSYVHLSSIINTEIPEYTGEGTVTLKAPEYSDPTAVLFVNFENSDAADSSGYGNTGTVTGSVSYVDSYDGSTALYVNNNYSAAASQYILFEALKGVDLTLDDFTVAFWAKIENGGASRWYGSGAAAETGSGIGMSRASSGGVIFSNTNSGDGTAPGLVAAQLNQTQYLAVGLIDENGDQTVVDGMSDTQDARWHQVTVTVERGGYYKVYIDGALFSVALISDSDGETLGVNSLSLGADVLGQYGVGSTTVDDFTVYNSALSMADVQALYYVGNLNKTIHDAENSMDVAGEEFTEEAISTMEEALQTAQTLSASITMEHYEDAVAAQETLKAALDTFLLSPTSNANMSMVLISDIHIASTTDARAKNLRTLFADLETAGVDVDGIIQSGDFADTSTAAALEAAFDVMNEVLSTNSAWQLIGCIGNHEQQWLSQTSNYTITAETYIEQMQRHISGDEDVREQGTGVLDSYWNYTYTDETGSAFTGAGCYAMTFEGYHYVVINTDNPGQYGAGDTYTDADNEMDSIRHGMWMSDETLEWLDNQLAEYAEDGLPIFVIGHYPFKDTVPLSTFSPIPIQDNSVGKQDAEIRNILASYDNVIYFCGHLHNGLGVSEPVTVTAENGGTFIEVNLPTLKSMVRGYLNIPSTWYMFVYDTEIVLLARDVLSGEWLTEYNVIIPLSTENDTVTSISLNTESLTLTAGKTSTLEASVTPEDANVEIEWTSSNESVATVDSNGVVTAVANGTAIITASVGDITASCTVTVSTYVDDSPVYTPPTTKTETKKNEDGSTTRTVTDLKTGAVTETTTWPDGTRLVTTTGKDGKVSSEVTIPSGRDSVTLTIPTAQRPGPGEVAAVVRPDGSREIVRSSVATEDGIRITLTKGARLEIVDNSKFFIDVETGDWFDASVQFVASRELMGGTGAETFSPAAPTSRAMLMTILARLDGQDTAAGESWHSVGMEWAVAGGISDGIDPDVSITREQLAVMLYRYAKAERTEGDLSKFSDVDDVSAWATEAMAWAVERGIIRGANGRLNPTATATRAEIAAMLERFVMLTRLA